MPPAASREAPTPAGALVERYAEYLLVRRGLAAETVRGYCNTARAFLADRERIAGDLALGALDVAAINDYLLRRSRRGSIASSKAAVTGLRSLLRFLHVQGLIDRDLAVAVAPVATWRLASLVRALDADSVGRLLDSCDRATAVGRRDFAILLLLSRLGLRIGEVAALRLDDLDWRAGELVVRGKRSRQERLPLPVDVGEAVAVWLRDGRPDCQSRFVFIRARAPHDGLHPSALTSVVHRACRRAGVPRVGAHRLRHTAATEMLRAGTSLREVGQVLRHRSSEVTSIYAKVDRARAERGRPAVARSGGMTALAHHIDDYLAIRRASASSSPASTAYSATSSRSSTPPAPRRSRSSSRCGGQRRRRGRPRLSGAADARGARVCALSARHRSGHRDPAARAAARAPAPPDAAHLQRGRDRGADGRAARTLRPPLRAATIETLIGLLACTGLRVSEAFALDRADIDTDNRLLRIRDSKFGKSREVLVHDGTLAALHAYLARRDQLAPRRRSRLRIRLKRGSAPEPQRHAAGLRPDPPGGRRHRLIPGPLATGT